MEVELDSDSEETSEDENGGLDGSSEICDYMNFEGERCGICMEVVVDQGVLDCCQHWFCFTCIDNWSTITSLCPLCQKEFQLITCVPVFDTAGGSQTDEESNLSDDDWFIEGKNSALSFPSYYIDENAVLCLGEDGCKIRNGAVAVEGESDVDTSIACDSCDKWYHAICVGFDSEGSCDNSWLCPGCTGDKGPQKADSDSTFLSSHQHVPEFSGDHSAEASISAGVSTPVADEGQASLAVSMVDEQQKYQEPSDPLPECREDGESNLPHVSVTYGLNTEALQIDGNKFGSDSYQNVMEISPLLDKRDILLYSPTPTPLEVSAEGISGLHPYHGFLETGNFQGPNGSEENFTEVDTMPILMEPDDTSKPLSPVQNVVLYTDEVYSPERVVPFEKESDRTTGGKRKLISSRYMDDGEVNLANKKSKSDRTNESMDPMELPVAVFDDSNSVPTQEEDGTFDIMDFVKETDSRERKKNQNIGEKGNATGLRLKKIMRIAGDEKDSSVQELRDKIREAVRNKSSEEVGKNLFDPKLLEAFRAAFAGSGTEAKKLRRDVKAERSFLQKGRVRENLTKKIYGAGGKRRRAWTRDCDVEFWKHRCVQGSRPVKVETLKAVLDLLRDDSSPTKITSGKKEEDSPLLSRLYLADTSVFPRKSDAIPFSAPEAAETSKLKTAICSNRKPFVASASDKCLDTNSQQQRSVSLFPDGSESSSAKGMKSRTLGDTVGKKDPGRTLPSAAHGDKPIKSDIKSDKRKWALDVLARKTVASSDSSRENEEDGSIHKFPVLAQLPKDMRPVLASSHHNKIPILVRQAQLFRLTEHFLKKLNVSAICRTAETELAVADAINIEKHLADKSNSKVVYLNLCSQELLRRSDELNLTRAPEASTCSTLASPKETDNCSLDLDVDEALKRAGLVPDSPPSSPDNLRTKIDDEVDVEGPEDVLAAASHPEAELEGEFEHHLEDISNQLPEPPDKQNGLPDPELPTDEASAVSSHLPGSEPPHLEQEASNADHREDAHPICSSSACNDQEPNTENCLETASVPPSIDDKVEKTAEHDPKQSKHRSSVVKKVEAYVKEHLRPLCRSGVITVEQYRWAVGKTTEKVMKYHAKERNASFLIKEGDKVKKLALEYVEASQHKPEA